jgi:ferredoxin
MGCGICAAECPARAIQLNHFEATHFNVMLDNLFPSLTDEGTMQITKTGA